MSTIKVDTIQTSAGAGQYTAKAWVNFNGTGTVAIRDSGNVSSITDRTTGKYRENVSNAFSNANFANVLEGGQNLAANWQAQYNSSIGEDAVPTTTTAEAQGGNSINAVFVDPVYMNVLLIS